MSSHPTLLLADDSLTIQRVVALTFADQPVRVVVAKDGQDAINRMVKERPDLVLADTNMPCVDGYQLARWVRDQPHLSTVPVLLLAGVADPVDEQRLYDSGANGVLEKPFEPSHVISRVKELLGIKRAPPAAAGRLVTAPDVNPPSRKPEPERRQADTAAVVRRAAASPPAGAPVSEDATGHDQSTGDSAPFDLPPAPGDARDWFPDDSPQPSFNASGTLVGETPGRSASPLDAPVADRAGWHGDKHADPFASTAVRSRPVSSTADVFESLLAAEQGAAGGPVLVQAAPELTPAALDDLATRVVERLGPELQTLAGEMRSTIAEVVQAAVNGAIPTLGRQVQDALVLAIRDSVRDIMDGAVRDALANAVATTIPAAVVEAVRGDGGEELRALVRETAERLITEEIARIRQPRD